MCHEIDSRHLCYPKSSTQRYANFSFMGVKALKVSTHGDIVSPVMDYVFEVEQISRIYDRGLLVKANVCDQVFDLWIKTGSGQFKAEFVAASGAHIYPVCYRRIDIPMPNLCFYCTKVDQSRPLIRQATLPHSVVDRLGEMDYLGCSYVQRVHLHDGSVGVPVLFSSEDVRAGGSDNISVERFLIPYPDDMTDGPKYGVGVLKAVYHGLTAYLNVAYDVNDTDMTCDAFDKFEFTENWQRALVDDWENSVGDSVSIAFAERRELRQAVATLGGLILDGMIESLNYFYQQYSGDG